ncbi:hypothetical protein IMCC14465_13100 [alpha proteobacterium IMCC14465]|uniref:Uncharacterized protein n=1 Tax=alpha proteobacterium IMCC14465 TaxID=1220535 RepID=J9E0T7_9PROT|nr:hypothetical protein IMCC14465_13100 [alpha proteobacterium IMCC14465]
MSLSLGDALRRFTIGYLNINTGNNANIAPERLKPVIFNQF